VKDTKPLDLEGQLNDIFGAGKASEKDTKTMIEESFKQYRNSQLNSAYQAALKEYKGGLNIASVAGFLISANPLSRTPDLSKIVDFARSHLKKTNKTGTDSEKMADDAASVVATQAQADEMIIKHLVQYAKDHKVKTPEKIVDNKKAFSYAITKTYGSIENYQQQVLADIIKFNDMLNKAEKVDDKVTDIGGDVLKVLGSQTAQKYAKWLPAGKIFGLGKAVLGQVSDYKNQLVGFGKVFLKNYGIVRSEEIKSYQN